MEISQEHYKYAYCVARHYLKGAADIGGGAAQDIAADVARVALIAFAKFYDPLRGSWQTLLYAIAEREVGRRIKKARAKEAREEMARRAINFGKADAEEPKRANIAEIFEDAPLLLKIARARISGATWGEIAKRLKIGAGAMIRARREIRERIAVGGGDG